MADKEKDVSTADFLYIGSILEQYKTYVDLLIVVVIGILVCFTMFLTKNKERESWMLAISALITTCIMIYSIRRIYFTIKADFMCIANETTAGIAMDTTTKLRTMTSFLYYYVLTYLGAIIWASIAFVIVFMFYVLVKINTEYNHWIEILSPGWVLPNTWIVYKWFALFFAYIVIPIALLIKIPLIFYKKKYENWFFDMLNWLKDATENKIFEIVFSWVAFAILPGTLFLIEGRARKMADMNYLRIFFYDTSHIQLFKALDFRKHSTMHLRTFISGFVLAAIYALIILGPVQKPCEEEWYALNNKFMFGYFMTFTFVVMLYMIESGKFAFDAFLKGLQS